MDIKSACNSRFGQVLKEGRDVFGYVGNDSPSLVYVDSQLPDGSNANMNPDTGEISVSGMYLRRTLKVLRDGGYKTDEDHIAVHALSEEVSHYMHSKVGPGTTGLLDSYVDEINFHWLKGNISGLIEGFSKYYGTTTYVEAVGKGAGMMIEKRLGLYSRSMHHILLDYYMKSSINWKAELNMLKNMPETEAISRCDKLGWLFSITHKIAAQKAGKELSMETEKMSLESFRKMSKKMDAPVYFDRFKSAMSELFPGIDQYMQVLAVGNIGMVLMGKGSMIM